MLESYVREKCGEVILSRKNETLFARSDIFKARLIDDAFFYAVVRLFPIVAERIASILLHKEVRFIKSELQKTIRIAKRHSPIMDYIGTSKNGSKVNIEVQRKNEKNIMERSLAYLSVMEIDIIRPGMKYEDLPSLCTIFLCEKDPYGEGLPYYGGILNWIGKNKEEKHRGVILFNCSYKGDDEYGRLSSALLEQGYNGDGDEVILDAIRQCKTDDQYIERIKNDMCELVERACAITHRQGREEGKIETKLENAKNLLSGTDLSPKAISELIGLPLEEVLKIAKTLATES